MKEWSSRENAVLQNEANIPCVINTVKGSRSIVRSESTA
jgi:hypothetical protein